MDIMHFQITSRKKAVGKKSESSRLEFSKTISANNFTLSAATDNTYGPFYRERITDLSLLITLLAIHLKSHKASF